MKTPTRFYHDIEYLSNLLRARLNFDSKKY